FDCLPEVSFCFVDQRPTFLAEDGLMVRSRLGQQLFKSFGVAACLLRVSSLVEPVEDLVVKITYLVPLVGELAPVGGWVNFHLSASAVSASFPAVAFARQAAENPTRPTAFGGLPALPGASSRLSFEIASSSVGRSYGCDPDRACA